MTTTVPKMNVAVCLSQSLFLRYLLMNRAESESKMFCVGGVVEIKLISELSHNHVCTVCKDTLVHRSSS